MLDKVKTVAKALAELPSDETLKRLLALSERLDKLPSDETLKRLVEMAPLLDRVTRDGAMKDLQQAGKMLTIVLASANYERLLRLLELLPRDLPDQATLERLIRALEKMGDKADVFAGFLQAVKAEK